MTYTQKIIVPKNGEVDTKLIKTSTAQKVSVLNNNNKDNIDITISG
jgi:hypothetical protein